MVREGSAPEEIAEVVLGESEASIHLPSFLADQLGQSSSHWRRVIDQGGVKIDGRAVESYDLDRSAANGAVVQAGKRQFLRIRAA